MRPLVEASVPCTHKEREGDDKMGLMEGDLTIGDEIGTIIKYA